MQGKNIHDILQLTKITKHSKYFSPLKTLYSQNSYFTLHIHL